MLVQISGAVSYRCAPSDWNFQESLQKVVIEVFNFDSLPKQREQRRPIDVERDVQHPYAQIICVRRLVRHLRCRLRVRSGSPAAPASAPVGM
ncbi:capsid protein [Paraburkholderia sp. MM5496-R1]